MRVVLLGAPGSGKGTQGEALAKHFGVDHVSSGELFREHIASGTELGRQVDDFVTRGDLVPGVARVPARAAERVAPGRF